ncbi:30S ribosomal protein S6 [Fodinicola acaciae]|uniref:30S ribosomal protein S6 n=1 Tax=Fodinicola acaciae TaxID=2681555 RepID=UPI002483A439|nr:30S ribosomal protein S6 [Fodinicola acaciae]
MARHYEVMVILDPELDERTVAPSLDQFLSVVRNAGGTVEKVDVWGRRRLAYEINKKAEGIYAVIDVQSDPDAVAELDRQLNLTESVLRTKVLRPELR